LNSNYNWGV
jgi:ubiquinol-cytochrome c reductase cytochrome b subunit